MSDFKKYLKEQLQDPDFALLWAFRNELILQHTAGNMALSEMELTDEDKARILHILENPDELNAVLEQLIHEHTVDKKLYEEAMAEHRKNPITYSHEEVGKMLRDSALPDAMPMDNESENK